MFGWSVRTLQSGGVLVIVDPISITALFWTCLFTVGPLVYLCSQRPLPLRRISLIGTIAIILFGFVLDGTRVTMNRVAGTMQVERFALFHWMSTTIPLSQVSRAFLTTGATTSRITVQKQDGSTFSLSGNNQMGGKPEAELAMNRYLGLTD